MSCAHTLIQVRSCFGRAARYKASCLRQLDWYFIPFSVVWLGLVLFISLANLKKTPEPMGAAMSVVFVGIGIYWLVGRFFADSFYRSRLVFGLTDRRAIILAGVFGRSVQSIDLFSLNFSPHGVWDKLLSDMDTTAGYGK
jgi:hypothetical protein